MNKSFILAAVASMAALFSCSQPGAYTINGSSDILSDGDTVFLVHYAGRSIERFDSTIVNAGKFTFKGIQETPDICGLTFGSSRRLYGLMFLEEGTMTATLDSTTFKVSGTPNNDGYNEYRDVTDPLLDRMNGAWKGYFAPTTTDEQRAEMVRKHDEYEKDYSAAICDQTLKNISTPLGLYLLKENYSRFDYEGLYNIVEQIPEETIAADERLAKIKENATKKYATRPGQMFTDFTMEAPDGTTVKLSDYVGKGKYVLVDFWASWCGPCCREMPNVVELYAKYKDSGMFEIVGVSLDDEKDSWTEALKQHNMTWPQMSDLKGWKCEGAALYGVNGIPHTVLIDPQGIIIERDLRETKLADKLAELLTPQE